MDPRFEMALQGQPGNMLTSKLYYSCCVGPKWVIDTAQRAVQPLECVIPREQCPNNLCVCSPRTNMATKWPCTCFLRSWLQWPNPSLLGLSDGVQFSLPRGRVRTNHAVKTRRHRGAGDRSKRIFDSYQNGLDKFAVREGPSWRALYAAWHSFASLFIARKLPGGSISTD